MRQGERVGTYKLKQIEHLLRDTDTEIPDIARRMGVSRSCVSTINCRLHIREYVSNTSWRVGDRLVEAA